MQTTLSERFSAAKGTLAAGALCEVHYLDAPPAAVAPGLPIDSLLPGPAKQALDMMALHTIHHSIRPALAAATKDEFIRIAVAGLREFIGALDASARVMRASVSEPLYEAAVLESSDVALQRLRESAAHLAGDDASAEVDFCSYTFRNAAEFVRHFPSFDLAPTLTKEDLDHRAGYNFGAGLYFFGLTSVGVLSAMSEARAEIVNAAFETLRYGALTAYFHAEQGFALRRQGESTDDSPDNQECAFGCGELDAIDAG